MPALSLSPHPRAQLWHGSHNARQYLAYFFDLRKVLEVHPSLIPFFPLLPAPYP